MIKDIHAAFFETSPLKAIFGGVGSSGGVIGVGLGSGARFVEGGGGGGEGGRPTDHQSLPPCPDTSDGHGFAVRTDLDNLDWPMLNREHSNLLSGGRWKPTTCAAKHHLAVIIPYR